MEAIYYSMISYIVTECFNSRTLDDMDKLDKDSVYTVPDPHCHDILLNSF